MRNLIPLASLLLLTACAGPRLSVIHDPLYRAENHTSSITARATETSNGIAEVRIEAVIGELTACNGTLPSLIPCRTNAAMWTAVCYYQNVMTEVTCTLPLAITARRLVTYRATARSSNNRTSRTSYVTYAGGAPLTRAIVDLGFIRIPIDWETARPVIWRTDAPSSTAERGNLIDWGFLPDTDMPNYRAFTDDMQPMLLAAFYTDANTYSQWTRLWKNIFNFWAGPTGANGEGCTRTFAAPASTVRSVFDGSAILHRNAFRDCASISLGGGAGTTQTNLADAPWVMLHEAGHYIFGLGDEYDGGGNWSISTPKNVFANKASCETASTDNGLPTAQCAQIGATGTWRNDDGQNTTMEDRVLSSDWRTLSGKAVNVRRNACFGGTCY